MSTILAFFDTFVLLQSITAWSTLIRPCRWVDKRLQALIQLLCMSSKADPRKEKWTNRFSVLWQGIEISMIHRGHKRNFGMSWRWSEEKICVTLAMPNTPYNWIPTMLLSKSEIISICWNVSTRAHWDKAQEVLTMPYKPVAMVERASGQHFGVF